MKKNDLIIIEKAYQRARKKGVHSSYSEPSYASENRDYGRRCTGHQFGFDTKGFALLAINMHIESWSPARDTDKYKLELKVLKKGELVFRAIKDLGTNCQFFTGGMAKGPGDHNAERSAGSDYKPGEEKWEITDGGVKTLELIRDKREKV